MKSLFNQFLNLIIVLTCILLFFVIIFLFNEVFDLKTDKLTPSIEVSLQKENLKTKMFKDSERIENGIHIKTGMAWDKNFNIVRANCTSCHSSKLITQNRATREGWAEMITWMQKTQGLHKLGENKKPILDYLSKHYAPRNKGRRQSLDHEAIDWYQLD